MGMRVLNANLLHNERSMFSEEAKEPGIPQLQFWSNTISSALANHSLSTSLSVKQRKSYSLYTGIQRNTADALNPFLVGLHLVLG